VSEDLKQLVRKNYENVWNQGDVSVADQIYADNYIAHIANMPSAISSVEEFKQFVVLFRALSPDLFFTVEDQIAEGDKVATRWTATIRNTGELSASEPAGGDIIVAGMSIHKVVDGRGWRSPGTTGMP
jgi:predicted ester cyclase